MADYEIRKYGNISLEIRRSLYVLGELQNILYENGDTEQAKKFEDTYQRLLQDLQVRS